MSASKPEFQWDDPFFLEDQLSEEERLLLNEYESIQRNGNATDRDLES